MKKCKAVLSCYVVATSLALGTVPALANDSESIMTGSDSLVMPQKLFWLPHTVEETSALASTEKYLWTLNDSGDFPRLYGLNSETGKIEKTLRVKGSVSEDWESLAASSEFLIIADTGNNRGKRKVLNLYKVKLSDLDESAIEVDAKKISFRYADYLKHTKGRAKYHNVDCEAVTFVGDELWLFTKNRGDLKTRLYKVDLNATEEQSIEPVGEFPINGLVTGVDYNAETSTLAILGYGSGLSFGQGFVWQVKVADGLPDWDSAERFDLAEAGQWEAILWQAENRLLITAERSVYGAQRAAEITLPK